MYIFCTALPLECDHLYAPPHMGGCRGGIDRYSVPMKGGMPALEGKGLSTEPAGLLCREVGGEGLIDTLLIGIVPGDFLGGQ